MTLLPEETRREQISAALEAHKPEQHENANVPWKGGSEICSVVKISLDAAVLNHKSHRIRAELESHPDAEEIKADPFSQGSQDLVADVLRGTVGFEPLKEDLAGDEGQRDCGIITEAGLLVNGNTRAVALRDLVVRHIKVAVLPGDATEQEIADLELRLQMQRDFKQAYTFTNELLFVEDLISIYGYSQDDVAKARRRSEKEVAQFTRLLALIREIQARARSVNRIPLTFFDEEKKEQILIELDQAYEKKRARDPEAARRLRDARILALLAGNTYRDIRLVDESFAKDYLLDSLREQEQLGEEIATIIEAGVAAEGAGGEEVDLPGVEDVMGDEAEPTENGFDLSKLVDLVAQSHGDENVELPTGYSGRQIPRDQVLAVIADAIAESAEEKKTDDKRVKGLGGPINLLKDARKKLRRVEPAYSAAASDPAFNQGAFEYEVNKLGSDADALQAEVKKHKRK